MNDVERRFAELLITESKYSERDLHKIKDCLCFLRDAKSWSCPEEDLKKVEAFLTEFILRKENDIVFDTKELELSFGIEN